MPATRALKVQSRSSHGAAPGRGVLYPLDALYDRIGVALPVVKPVAANRIPPPYRDLLVHQNEMTLTLEQHFGGPVTVRVLESFMKGRSYFRRVLLASKGSGRPVAMGAVRLRLEAFSPRIRARILRGHVPLGRILRDAGILYDSRPTAFFEVSPNAEMLGVFWMPQPKTMYGRRTEVIVGTTRVGDIVEILPLV